MLKNMKIGKLLILTFMIVSIVASISGITSIYSISNIDSQYSYALTNYGFAQGDIGKAMCSFLRMRVAVRDIVSFTDEEEVKNAKARFDEYSNIFNDSLPNVKKTLTTQEDMNNFQTIENDLVSYTSKQNEIIKLGNTNDPELSKEAQRALIDDLDPIFDNIYENFTQLMDRNVSIGNQLSSEMTALGKFSLLLNIVLLLVSLMISILIAAYISKSITKPLKEIETATTVMADGSLNTKIQYKSKNEFGNLAEKTRDLIHNLKAIISDMQRGLGEMAQGNFDISPRAEFKGDFIPLRDSIGEITVSLSDTLGQINEASDQVSGGSDQVSSGAQALSQGTTEQASSIQELAATINEISEQINENATNAVHASAEANSVGAEAVESNERMKKMLVAMSEISSGSSEISKIIKTIEDIAFQTNILALNAAVEAARAGSAGKGFAVVADEVRNLASKSTEASKNTAALIEGSLKAVENGTIIADETAHSLSNVVSGISDVAATIDKISQASKEQAQSITQITTGIDQISSVIQTNSATAEESAAASEELSSQAQMLKNLVGQFNLLNK